MKNLLKFITCGSVDDGKSTLIGHILYDTKKLYTDQEQALELDSKVGSRGGEIPLTLVAVAALYLTQEILGGLFSADNISHLSHIVGGVCGAVMGLFWH